MQLGFHAANLSWPGGARTLGPDLARVGRDVEAAGIKRLTVMDHVWQISAFGPPEKDMLEAYTTLGFLAANTSTVLLHTLVTGVVYRSAGLLAKIVSTLDVLSGGRAGLGIGAAWNEEESAGLGLPFPPTKERFERLEETIQVALQMWAETDDPFVGQHYQLGRTLNVPQTLSRPRPYLLIGGVGERKTLKFVAQYADAANIFFGPEVDHKLEVLRGHADALGRDFDTIELTTSSRVTSETTRDSLLAQLKAFREKGFTVGYFSSLEDAPWRAIELLGSVADEVGTWG